MRHKLPIFCTILLIFAVLALSSPVEASTPSAGEILIEVPIDIQPNLCPNKLNLSNGGKLTVVIAGTEALPFAMSKQYHMMDIDVAINGIKPFQWRIEDVVTPHYTVLDDLDPNDCSLAVADGVLDLVLHFDAGAVADSLDDPKNHDVVALILSGSYGEIDIVGGDLVIVVDPGPGQASPAKAVRVPQACAQESQGPQRQRAGNNR